VLSHEAVTRGPIERARYRLKAQGRDVTWGGGQLFHIGTLAPFIGSLGVAGTFLTDTYFEPARALQLMYAEKVTLAWPWFSAIAQGLIGHPTFDPAKLEGLRYLFLIAPPTIVNTVQGLLPKTEIIQACGMTETAGIFALCDRDESAESRSTSHGKPAPGIEVRIVDPETGTELPNGHPGEIWVRGYNVMDKYWAAAEKTSESLTPEGWLKTGDLYTRLPNGSLVFGGRYKDMLKVGGENVAAVEVEAVLCTHPAVKTAEVVGRPDKRLDEVHVAFVELHAGRSADAETLIAHCRGKLANYKVPRAVYFMNPGDWPMSATKIDKRTLRDRAREGEK
jgi:fatty-acyl-CoA synthase/long-chain acyl-CoA synthetase